ncbi:MAG: hypothetical protein GY935_11650 [Gammaproteobacteria bacterium]|nr:hypothetical protein [Gammaproteobacteria bacterium]
MRKATSNPSCNTNFRVNLPTLIFLSLFLSFAGQAADSVGAIKFARGDVTIESISGEKRKAVKGDDLKQKELIVTGAASVAVIQLNDDSQMTLRPNSEFRVNQLHVDDDSNDSSSSQSAVLNLLRGGLRLVTGLIGKLNPAGYRLSTPVATIGIRGTEFNTRICNSDCADEEKLLAGSDAAAKVNEGLYVNVDEGQIFLRNFSLGEPLDLRQGESGYVSDLNSLPVKLSLVPAFQALDKIPSPSQLDFDDIEIPDDTLQPIESAAEVAVVAAASASASEEAATELDISGTYEIDEINYQDLPLADRRWFFGANPDIEFTFTQKGDKIKGEFSGDRDGTIKGKIDDEEVAFEFVLEAKGGEFKKGAGTWIVQDDDSLKGDFKVRDQQRGIVRGRWILTKIE